VSSPELVSFVVLEITLSIRSLHQSQWSCSLRDGMFHLLKYSLEAGMSLSFFLCYPLCR
jgi:hypothetical protein